MSYHQKQYLASFFEDDKDDFVRPELSVSDLHWMIFSVGKIGTDTGRTFKFLSSSFYAFAKFPALAFDILSSCSASSLSKSRRAFEEKKTRNKRPIMPEHFSEPPPTEWTHHACIPRFHC